MRTPPLALTAPILLALALLAPIANPAAADSEPRPVSIQGSTVFYDRLIEPFRYEIERRAERRVNAVANKSIHGLVALLEGRAELAMISSRLEFESAVLSRFHPSLPADRLVAHEIARTRVAFARHPGNPVVALSLAQIRAILLGEVANWKQLGGPDLPIAVVTVQPGGGVPSTVRMELLDGRAFTPARLIEVEAPRHVVKVVAQEPGALGVTQLGLVQAGNVPEFATDRLVEQHLVLVSLGEPDEGARAVIEALRRTAELPAR